MESSSPAASKFGYCSAESRQDRNAERHTRVHIREGEWLKVKTLDRKISDRKMGKEKLSP